MIMKFGGTSVCLSVCTTPSPSPQLLRISRLYVRARVRATTLEHIRKKAGGGGCQVCLSVCQTVKQIDQFQCFHHIFIYVVKTMDMTDSYVLVRWLQRAGDPVIIRVGDRHIDGDQSYQSVRLMYVLWCPTWIQSVYSEILRSRIPSTDQLSSPQTSSNLLEM